MDRRVVAHAQAIIRSNWQRCAVLPEVRRASWRHSRLSSATCYCGDRGFQQIETKEAGQVRPNALKNVAAGRMLRFWALRTLRAFCGATDAARGGNVDAAGVRAILTSEAALGKCGYTETLCY